MSQALGSQQESYSEQERGSPDLAELYVCGEGEREGQQVLKGDGFGTP